MNTKDISTIHHFLGVVEGTSISLSSDVQSLLYDYVEVVDKILEKEEEGNNDD